MSEAETRLLQALAPFAAMGGRTLIMLAFPELDADMVLWRRGEQFITVEQVREARAAFIAAGGRPSSSRSRTGRFT
jgi:hypothetical protein